MSYDPSAMIGCDGDGDGDGDSVVVVVIVADRGPLRAENFGGFWGFFFSIYSSALLVLCVMISLSRHINTYIDRALKAQPSRPPSLPPFSA